MTFTSLSFLIFIIAAAIIYYLTPGKIQWMTLLIISAVFYFLAATPYTIVFIIIAALTAYLSTLYIETHRDNKAGAVTAIGVIIITAIWFLLKGNAFWIQFSSFLHSRIPAFPALKAIPLAASLGMGFYTFQAIAYIIDCYWKSVVPQKNFFKLVLFLLFFPLLTTGPICRYHELQSLYDGHKADIERIERGAQRILWGLFKKLVLSERLAAIVNTVDGDPGKCTGLWLWIAFFAYPMQLYSDFSGSVDIALGTAEIFGIILPENFDSPFFSQTSQEFWQRWHMSLGNWARDYIMYPVLKSEKTISFSAAVKKRFGKRAGKLASLGIGLFMTWMVTGIWHGNYKYVLGCGVYYFAIMFLYEVFTPQLKAINSFLHVNEESFSWRLFRSLRTFLVFCVSMVFFRAEGISTAFSMLKNLAGSVSPAGFNPWIFIDGSLSMTGLSSTDFFIILLSLVLLLLAALMREKCGHAREWIASQGIVFRWAAWIALFVLVVIYGKYGPGYHAADFIYQGF
ncbi:MAG: hypothetical protein K5668_11545 [Lachnospiraceae bacterium]|nr:hypothetical protein [Lachnospiraceae bacterium]